MGQHEDTDCISHPALAHTCDSPQIEPSGEVKKQSPLAASALPRPPPPCSRTVFYETPPLPSCIPSLQPACWAVLESP